MTGMTDHLPLPIPIGSLTDKNMGLQKPVVGTNAMGGHVIHHINLDDGGSLQNVGLQLHIYTADPRKPYTAISHCENLKSLIYKSL
jgi:hypothetical protein